MSAKPARLRIAEDQPRHARRGGVDDVEAVPAVLDEAERLDQRQRRAEAAGRERARADDHRRPLGRGERLGHRLGQLAEQFEVVAEPFGVEREIDLGPDGEDLAALARDLAQAGVDQRRFPARVGADQQHRIGMLDAGDGRVERDRGQVRHVVVEAGLPAFEQRRALLAQQRLGGDTSSRRRAGRRRWRRRSIPAAFSFLANRSSASLQLASRSLPFSRTHGRSRRLRTKSVDMVARLVADPLLVDVVVDAREDPHHLPLADVEADVGADRVHHVDARHLREAPTGASRKSAASAAARRPGRRRRGCRQARWSRSSRGRW